MNLLEQARINLDLAGYTSGAYITVFVLTTLLVTLAFF